MIHVEFTVGGDSSEVHLCVEEQFVVFGLIVILQRISGERHRVGSIAVIHMEFLAVLDRGEVIWEVRVEEKLLITENDDFRATVMRQIGTKFFKMNRGLEE